MVAAWKSWNFSDAMILEAAKRSTNASAPLPYMNKLLSEWKREGVFSPDAIKERDASAPTKPVFRSEAAIAADKRGEREHYYAVLRQRAAERAEKANATAQRDAEYGEADRALKREKSNLPAPKRFPRRIYPL